jgi:putative ABC transport system permease protein
MDEIFGLSMNVIMVALLILLGICLLTTLWIIFRRPVMFKLGLRNVPRRPAQTVLVIIGLMLSTLIIAAALGTGDTIDHSATAATYKSLGHADELVVYSQDESGEGSAESALNDTIPQSTVDEVESLFADSDLVDGVMPLLIENVPAFLFEGEPPSDSGELQAAALSGEVVQAEPTSNLVGIDPARVPDFGGLKSVDGSDIALEDLGQGEIVISEEMADDLGAEVGDWIGFAFENRPMTAQVTAIAEDSPLSGRYDQDTPGMVMPLARLQELTGKADLITMVAVSNKGGVRDSLQYTDAVVDRLREAFKGEPLGVDPIKQDLIDQAKESSSIFTTFFLIFGLFSIAVGILLIVLIFAMLAAERRPEMGMARAVGAQRAQLVHSFLSEGTIYALLAGFVGAALGVLAALSIGLALDRLFDEFFDIDPYVSLRSMVVAYCLGVVITFLAVVYASIRNSRLNIVAAIRDIPDVSSPVRKKRTL